MQFVYILVNEHVPNLVKFGFTTRDPATRADELSGPTAVPGRWEVYRYWEVSDGASVERLVYQRLAEYRLGRQEFLKLQPGDAARHVGRIISTAGIDPTEQEAARAAQAAADAKKRQEAAAARQRALNSHALETSRQIDLATEHLHERIRKAHTNAQIGISVAIGLAVLVFGSNQSGILAILKALVAPLLLFPLTMFVAVFFFGDSDAEREIAEIRRTIIARRGYGSDDEYVKATRQMDDA